MKFRTLFFVVLVSSFSVSAQESAVGWQSSEEFSLSRAAIGKMQVQAICHALVELKLREVELKQAGNSGAEKLSLVEAQQSALQQEIIRVTIAALEDDERRLSEKYLSEHPRMKAIRREIELRKAELKSTS